MAGGSSSRFVLTPHKVVLCILLKYVTAPRQGSTSHVTLPLASRHGLARLLLRFVKASAGLMEPTYEDMEKTLGKTLGSEKMFMEELHSQLKSFATAEDLFNVFFGLRDLVAAAPRPNLVTGRGDGEGLSIDVSSTLGIFLRRCSLSFNELSFEEVCRLLREVKQYRELPDVWKRTTPPDSPLVRYFEQHQFLGEAGKETSRSIITQGRGTGRQVYDESVRGSIGEDLFEVRQASGSAASAETSHGVASSSGDIINRRHFLRTSGEVEAYLSEQAVVLETRRSLQRNMTDNLAARLSELKELASHVPQVHYVQYLNFLIQKDYPAAKESLHRFFDFSAGEVYIPGSVTQFESGIGRLQAGLLALGHMHSHMGHVTMALQALNESILIAQQNNDNHCLLQALAALCNLFSEVGIYTDDDERSVWITHPGFDPECKVHPAPVQHFVGLLRRCLRRALELRLPQLIGFSRLALAKIKLQYVHRNAVISRSRNFPQFGTSPVEVCKMLRVNQGSLGPVDSNSFRTPSASQGRNSHADLTSVGQGHGMSGALSVTSWGWWKPQLKWLSRSMLKLGGTAQLLRASSWEQYGSVPSIRASTLVHIACYSDVSSADDLSLAYMKLFKLKTNLEGYAASYAMLKIAAKRFPVLSNSRVRAMELQCVVERALHRGDISMAEVANGELLALASLVSGVDTKIKVQASMYRIQIQLAKCQYHEAAVSAHQLFSLCYKGNLQQDSISLLLLMANIYKKSGNPVTGLPYVLASITLGRSLNLDLLQASAYVTLAELWVGLGKFPGRRALLLLQQCMPVVLGHGSLELRARANLAFVKCYLSDPAFSVQDAENLLDPLKSAEEESQRIEDTNLLIESLYLQAVVFDALAMTAERDEAAYSYQRCLLSMTTR